MQRILMTKGIQGSGKTTWALNEIKSNPGKYKRVNKDDLRALLDAGVYSKENEAFLLRVQEQIVMDAIRAGKDVIIDDTNFEEKHFNRMCQIAKHANRDIEVTEIFFDVDLPTAIKRDAQRPKPVGEKVITDYYNRYIKNAEFVIENTEVFKQEIDIPSCRNPDLDTTVICDLDGTAANLNGRDPYDASSCGEDLPNEYVLQAVFDAWCNGQKIIFVSGRMNKYREATIQWLNSHLKAPAYNEDHTFRAWEPIDYELYMRADNDNRKDEIVKKEIYLKHIKDKHNVLYVIDDRPRVVRMWRYDLGLPVFQVNDVEF